MDGYEDAVDGYEAGSCGLECERAQLFVGNVMVPTDDFLLVGGRQGSVLFCSW